MIGVPGASGLSLNWSVQVMPSNLCACGQFAVHPSCLLAPLLVPLALWGGGAGAVRMKSNPPSAAQAPVIPPPLISFLVQMPAEVKGWILTSSKVPGQPGEGGFLTGLGMLESAPRPRRAPACASSGADASLGLALSFGVSVVLQVEPTSYCSEAASVLNLESLTQALPRGGSPRGPQFPDPAGISLETGSHSPVTVVLADNMQSRRLPEGILHVSARSAQATWSGAPGSLLLAPGHTAGSFCIHLSPYQLSVLQIHVR